MFIIYSCYGGTHSSAVAAALHLGLLPRDRLPTRAELAALPYYDKINPYQHGLLFHLGDTPDGDRVYILGGERARPILFRLIRSLAAALGHDPADFLLIDVLPYVNTWMRLGGFLSRAWGRRRLGRFFLYYGTKKAYPHLLQLVEAVKALRS